MRYPPEEENKSDSINISESQLLGYSDSTSSSATSGASGSSLQDDGGGGSSDANNIATISEHVLFGNNNGQNSFLYLYYSRSTTENGPAENRRPFTAQGSNDKVGRVGKVMGSQKQWNDLSGGFRSTRGRGSAGPSLSPTFLNNNQDDKDRYEGKAIKPINRIINNDNTPYPVYIPPQEDNHQVSSTSPSPTKMGGKRKRDRLEMELEERNAEERSRLASLTEGLLEDDDDDWDKISPVPDVDPSYMYSAERYGAGEKREYGESQRSESIVSDEPMLIVSDGRGNLGISKPSLKSSTSSLKVDQHFNYQDPSRSSKRVNGNGGNGASSRRNASSNRSFKRLSPVSPTPSTPSTRSLKRVNPNKEQGVTHHHHQPHIGSSSNFNNNANAKANPAKRVSTGTGDGIDQMSFLNGIGAYFGTPASKRLTQNIEPTPEEIYEQELQGWKPRLATTGMIFTATMFILSCVSLLFVFPILVDPILVGFEAQFSPEPVMCRTTLFRNGSGSSECAIPSCREGCTIDLFSCKFIHVEYTPTANVSRMNTDDNVHLSTNRSLTNSRADSNVSMKQSGILLININGCGYPPEVTCSDFERKYGSIDSEYPCYYSHQNGSIVVPHYSRNTDLFHLTLAVCIPIGVVVLSGIILYLLVRYHGYLKTSIYRKYISTKRALREKNKDKENMVDEGEDGDEDVNDIEGEEKEVTSVSDLELDEDYDYDYKEIHYPKNQKVVNGASKTGVESRSMLIRSTQM